MAERITAEEAQSLKAETQKPSGEEPGGLPPEMGLEILGPEPEEFDTTIGKILVAPMNMGQIKKFMSISDVLVPAILHGAWKYMYDKTLKKPEEPEWHKDRGFGPATIVFVMDDGHEETVWAPWCGFFETLHGAKITSERDTDMEFSV